MNKYIKSHVFLINKTMGVSFSIKITSKRETVGGHVGWHLVPPAVLQVDVWGGGGGAGLTTLGPIRVHVVWAELAALTLYKVHAWVTWGAVLGLTGAWELHGPRHVCPTNLGLQPLVQLPCLKYMCIVKVSWYRLRIV